MIHAAPGNASLIPLVHLTSSSSSSDSDLATSAHRSSLTSLANVEDHNSLFDLGVRNVQLQFQKSSVYVVFNVSLHQE